MRQHIEPVSSVDSAWLAMEAPNNLMMICGILTFREPLDFTKLTEVVQKRFLRSERFRQRLLHPKIPLSPSTWTPPFWENDPDFDLMNHLHEITLPHPAHRGALRDAVSRLISTPLDMERPLWEMHLIHGFEGGSVLVERTHHCIADGVGHIEMQLSMCDDSPTTPEEEFIAAEEPETTLREDLLNTTIQHASAAANALFKFYGKVLHEAAETVSHPSHAIDLAQLGAEGAETVRNLLTQEDDPITLFKGPLGTAKRLAWSSPIPLRDVSQVKKALGGTINDTLICAIAGGLRRYLVQYGAPVDGLNFRAAIPVNLRELEDTHTLGNKFGLVFLSLPVGIADPEERLTELRKRMDRLKGSKEAPLFFGLLKALGHVPPKLQTPIVRLLANKITAVMSNVPGPAKPLYFAGQEVDNMMFFVPQAGRVALGISLFSYNGTILVGVNTDEGLIPDPEQIIDGFNQEFAVMQERAAAASPSTCQATTRRGARCKNRPLPDGPFCRLHQEPAK